MVTRYVPREYGRSAQFGRSCRNEQTPSNTPFSKSLCFMSACLNVIFNELNIYIISHFKYRLETWHVHFISSGIMWYYICLLDR